MSKKEMTLSRKEGKGGDGGTERGCGVEEEDVVGGKEGKGVRRTGERIETIRIRTLMKKGFFLMSWI